MARDRFAPDRATKSSKPGTLWLSCTELDCGIGEQQHERFGCLHTGFVDLPEGCFGAKINLYSHV